MGDRRYTTLYFGGRVKKSKLALIKRLAKEEGGYVDLNDGKAHPEIIIEECNYGQVESIENFLEANRIPFLKDVGAGDSGGWAEKYLADSFGVRERSTDDGDPMISFREVQRASKDPVALLALFEEADWWEKDIPPFEIVD